MNYKEIEIYVTPISTGNGIDVFHVGRAYGINIFNILYDSLNSDHHPRFTIWFKTDCQLKDH